MNFSELCLKRESTRSYIDKEVAREDLENIIKETALAPSACNSQPWKFVVCDGEKAKTISNCIAGKDAGINLWTGKVPAFVVVCETHARLMSFLTVDSQHYAQIDLGTAASTICYSAADKGIGSCIIGCFDEEKIKEELSIPEDVRVRLIVALGYTEKPTRNKARKDINDVFSFNQW